jgi:predicted AlkP superfamily phosphohydrolase/phosphomutase
MVCHCDAPRILIVGLDSATWLVMAPLLEAGRLPNLARLIAEGAHGPLRSSIPYVSAAAWVSFATGSNPGRHGVYDFVRRRAGGYGVELVNASTVRLPTLWQLLSERGVRVGVLNVPVTYPPCPVEGALVTGMLTPSLQSDFTYPPELKGRLLRAIPDYRLEPMISGAVARVEMKQRLQQDVTYGAEQRAAAARFLMQELGEWGFFMVVFTGLDRLQTYLWDDMDTLHPLHDPISAEQFADAIPAHYEQLDRLVGEILEEIDPRTTTVVVMSDHGLGAVHQFFFPNRWLADEGYLHWQRSTSAYVAWARQLLKRIGLGGFAKRVVARIFPGWAIPSQLRSTTLIRDVDWARTKVFWGADNGFWLNVKGREPQGIVESEAEYHALCDELRKKLLALRDPLYGEPVVAEVWWRGELYDGPFEDESPDLRIVWHEVPGERRTHFAAGEPWSKQAFGYTTLSGDHMRDGILVAWGRGVQKGRKVKESTIFDLAPTVLYLLGQPVPDHMDGHVLYSMLDPALVAMQPETRQRTFTTDTPEPREYSPEDKGTVEQRLRDLGYL